MKMKSIGMTERTDSEYNEISQQVADQFENEGNEIGQHPHQLYHVKELSNTPRKVLNMDDCSHPY